MARKKGVVKVKDCKHVTIHSQGDQIACASCGANLATIQGDHAYVNDADGKPTEEIHGA